MNDIILHVNAKAELLKDGLLPLDVWRTNLHPTNYCTPEFNSLTYYAPLPQDIRNIVSRVVYE